MKRTYLQIKYLALWGGLIFLLPNLVKAKHLPNMTTIQVTNTNDSGSGSLRAAITAANADPALDNIHFNIPGNDPHTITILTNLPTITDNSIIIDGSTQPGWSMGKIMITDGSANINIGLRINGNFCKIYGLYIRDFNWGIWLDSAFGYEIGGLNKGNVMGGNNTGIMAYTDGVNGSIRYNYIGTNATASAAHANSNGIQVQGDNVQITNNIVSGNDDVGILIDNQVTGSYPTNITIENNYIGTNLAGTSAIPNIEDAGIAIESGIGITINNNLISGNNSGININPWDNIDDITISNNKIGTNYAGTSGIGNSKGIETSQDAATNINFTNNTIAFNEYGLYYWCTAENGRASQNSIFCNTTKGIHLCSSANSSILPPIISTANTSQIAGTAAANTSVEIFISENSACGTAPCQGETYLGTAMTDLNGDWNIVGSFPADTEITAITISTTGNTSIFADCVTTISVPNSCQAINGTTILVTNTNDSGAGSLRQAIECANADVNLDNIHFNISGNGPYTIQLVTELPDITDVGVVIDGATQPNWSMGDIILDGTNISDSFTRGLYYRADYGEVYGLYLTNFSHAIYLGASNCRVGAMMKGNVINSVDVGISVLYDNTIVQANRIGTDPTGMTAIPIANNGISVNHFDGINNTQILNNLISACGDANYEGGINVGIDSGYDIIIQDNYIGTNATGTAALANVNGIRIAHQSSNVNITNNLIGGFTDNGVSFVSNGDAFKVQNATISGNTVGTDITGTVQLTTGTFGLNVSGKNLVIENNLVAFASIDGIQTDGDFNNRISQNTIFCNAINGIDLNTSAVTGPPQITSGSTTQIEGTVIANATVEVFMNDNTDCAGLPCQGKTYLGSTTANNSGIWILTGSFVGGASVTATATSTANNSSEFSECFTIQGSPNAFSISGYILDRNDSGLEGVTVQLDSETSMITDASGYYEFTDLDANTNYVIRPINNSDINNGVSIVDVIQTKSHSIGTSLLQTPYHIIAADVNSSESISIFDVIQIKAVANNLATEFPSNTPSWRFIPADYNFSDPTDPFPFPETRTYTNLMEDLTNQNFIGIKIGDTNSSATP